MKNKTLIIIGAVMVLLAVISVVSWLALNPADEPDDPELSVNKPVLSELPEAETTTKVVQAEITRKAITYEWESVIEPTISENYMIITAAGGNGEWQVFENEDSYENAEAPEGGEIAFD